MWTKFKLKVRAGWTRMKAWAIAVLIGLGLMSPLLYADTKDFSWTNPTQRTDGSAFDATTEQAEVRIYCDGSPTPTVVFLNDATSGSWDFGIGDHSCNASVVDTDNQESDRSGTVFFTITPARPNPPVLSVN